MQSHSLPAVNV